MGAACGIPLKQATPATNEVMLNTPNRSSSSCGTPIKCGSRSSTMPSTCASAVAAPGTPTVTKTTAVRAVKVPSTLPLSGQPVSPCPLVQTNKFLLLNGSLIPVVSQAYLNSILSTSKIPLAQSATANQAFLPGEWKIAHRARYLLMNSEVTTMLISK